MPTTDTPRVDLRTSADHHTDPPTRVIHPRKGLPGSRSVVGGLLVALAALGSWWAATGSSRGPAERYVVAARLIGPGQRIEADDVRLATAELPATVRAGAFAATDDVIGTVALGPIDQGELVQAGGLEEVRGPEGRELSFAVDTDWAVAGSLRPGDRIDVFATVGEGADASSTRVLAAATIQRVTAIGGDGLGETHGQTITVGIDDPDLVAPTVTATRGATITVVRVTGSPTRRGGR